MLESTFSTLPLPVMSVAKVKSLPWLKMTVPLLVSPPLRVAVFSPSPSCNEASLATRVLPVFDTAPDRVNAPVSISKESPEPIISRSPDSAQFSPIIFILAKPSPSFRPTKLLSSVPVPIRVRVFPVELVEITSPIRVEPVSSTRVLFLLLANITAAVSPLIFPLFVISTFALFVTLKPYCAPCTLPVFMTLVLPSLRAIPSFAVPVIVPALLMATPASAFRPVLPLITPVVLFEILTADEFSLTNIPSSKAVIFPRLLISPCIDSILIAVADFDVMAAPSSLFTTTRCAAVFISRPVSLPEIFPSLVILLIVNPVTDTAASLSAEDIVTSLLITYSASAEKS